MSVSGVSGGYSSFQNNNFQTIKNDFSTLSQALQSGDLSSAQKAFADIEKNMSNGPAQNSQGTQNSQRTDAFNALGQALKSGDLAGAQKAFASLQQSAGAHHGGHHHHHQAQASTSQPSLADLLNPASNDDGTSSTSGVDVTV
jgi:hypothetical protein